MKMVKKQRNALWLCLLLLVGCERGGDLSVVEKTIVDATPGQTWAIIGDFNDMERWHPAVVRTEILDDGFSRILYLEDGGEIREKLLDYTDGVSYRYKILSGPLPVENYVSTLSVEPTQDGRTRITWEANFDPTQGTANSEAQEIVRRVYRAGLDRLR